MRAPGHIRDHLRPQQRRPFQSPFPRRLLVRSQHPETPVHHSGANVVQLGEHPDPRQKTHALGPDSRYQVAEITYRHVPAVAPLPSGPEQYENQHENSSGKPYELENLP